ncbi:MAG TPA: hypothetical protein VF384_08965 [Planctomycetota bacterium]
MGPAPVADESRRTGPRPWILWGIACTPFLAILVYQIATTLFLCDDAFISFRYARNLLAGHGLAFNPGEYVEGYTNLLWTLEVAGLWCLGLRPELSAHVLSIALTAGTLALVVASALRLERDPHRRLVAWLALGLVACCPSFAVWSTSGLETRQFTFLIVLGSFLLTSTATSRRSLLLASLAFAAAELTRPETPMIFGCAFAWRVVQDRLTGQLQFGRVLALAAPFTVVIACHFLWRHGYYGEWLPNTYYAKHVRAWYESGFRYLGAATIELGAWVWVPLALAALWRRDAARDLTNALPFALIVPHALYLAHIGGDHFEYRPMDFYLPLLAVPAASGLVRLAGGLVSRLPTAAAERRVGLLRAVTIAACVPVLLYSHGLAAASLVAPKTPRFFMRLMFDENTAPLLQCAPGQATLRGLLTDLRHKLWANFVAVPFRVHFEFGRDRRSDYGAYERLPDGVFPADAMAAYETVGVIPFYLRELGVIDTLGLTDARVARTPSPSDNESRRMAHDRRAPPGYLRERGINVDVSSAASTESAALAWGDCALRVDENVWMPLRATDLEYVRRSFPSNRLSMRHRFDSNDAAANRIVVDGRQYDGVRLLATFEPADPGLTWSCNGDALVGPTRKPLMGGVGTGQLSIAGDPERESGSGSARSGEFTVEPGTMLLMLLAGKRALGVQVRLCRGGEVLRSLSPVADRLHPLVCPLDAWVGQQLTLEVQDRGPGWLVLDHVLLVRQSGGTAAAPGVAEPPARNPLDDFLRIAPLRSVQGCAASGTTTITVTNPMPQTVALSVELVEGPADARLRCGPWTRSDGSGVVQTLASGATATMQLDLEVPDAVRIDRQPFTLRVLVMDPPGTSDPPEEAAFEIPLPWQERD